MSQSKKDNLIKGKVQHYKENNLPDSLQLFVYVDENRGFCHEEEVVVLKCQDFPELVNIQDALQLRKKIEEHSESSKRVRELKQKLESAQESYNEGMEVFKIKTDKEIERLKKENKDLKRDNKELSLRLQDVTRRINELNSLHNNI